MSLFGKLFGKSDQKPIDAASDPAPKGDFSIDRANMFDLEQTRRVHELISVPQGSRDNFWPDHFFAALWNASIELPSENNPFTGPDGFSYLRIDLPSEGEFESQSLSNLVTTCLQRGQGAVLFPHPDATDPAYVMTMGILEGLVRYGDWRGDPVDLEESHDAPANRSIKLDAGERVLASTPSEQYLSKDSARALDKYLRSEWGIDEPRVLLLQSPAFTPSRALVINRRAEDFSSEQEMRKFVAGVSFFIPLSRSIMFMTENESEQDMVPLRALGAG